jgi:hypothetical protein
MSAQIEDCCMGDNVVPNMAATSWAILPIDISSVATDRLTGGPGSPIIAPTSTILPCVKRKSTGMGGEMYRMFICLESSSAKLDNSALDCRTAPIFCHDSGKQNYVRDEAKQQYNEISRKPEPTSMLRKNYVLNEAKIGFDASASKCYKRSPLSSRNKVHHTASDFMSFASGGMAKRNRHSSQVYDYVNTYLTWSRLNEPFQG